MIKIEKEHSYGILAIVAIVAIVALFNLSSTKVITTTESSIKESSNLVGEAMAKNMFNTIKDDHYDNFPGCEELDPYEWDGASTVITVIQLFIDDVESTALNDMVAAFKDGECRGVSIAADYGLGYISHELMIYTETAGELITFKAYDHSRSAILPITQTYNVILGDIISGDGEGEGFLNPWELYAIGHNIRHRITT
ncbi:hypothetical protein KY313_00240 [Candidatus Woesearchaeota archaeon]|nr:hypothetical protein [Candidatus Woesearchaeota archaeon]